VLTALPTDPDTSETTYRPFIYENGAMTPVPVPSFDSYGGDINDAGVVVGTMRAGGSTSNGTATAGSDFQFASGTVTFASGTQNAEQMAALSLAGGRFPSFCVLRSEFCVLSSAFCRRRCVVNPV
jgi:hypothetical protein